MAKAVLISIRPRWASLILSGEKTLEIRRTRPRLSPPFKCYIYCSKGRRPWVRKDLPGIRQDGYICGCQAQLLPLLRRKNGYGGTTQ